MSKFAAAAYFALVTAAAWYVIHVKVMNLSGLKDNPLLAIPTCFRQPGAKEYDFLPPEANAMLCRLNAVFNSIEDNPPAAAVMEVFGPVYAMMVFVAVYESFRTPSWVGHAATFFLLAGQIITAGVSTPFWLIFVAWARRAAMARGDDSARRPPPTEYVWTALAASLLGFIAPTLYMQAKPLDYDALSIWHPFPAYVFVLNLILPRLLRPSQPGAKPTVPILLMVLFGLYMSVPGHYAFITSGVIPQALRQEPAVYATPLAAVGHAIFLLDMTFVIVTMASFSVFLYDPASLLSSLAYLLLFCGLSAAVGPGGALALMWGYRETLGQPAGRKKQE